MPNFSSPACAAFEPPLACILEAFAPPVLRLVEDIPVPPRPGEVLLEMLFAPVNPADRNVLDGTYGTLPDLPATPGNEGCGRVLESNDPSIPGGALAIPLRRGTWRRFLTLPASDVVALPDDCAPDQAAMLTVNPATAWRLLHDFQSLQPGDWVVQNAATSGVGRAVIALARHLGWRTLNLVRRPEAIDELQSLGANRVVLESQPLDARSLCDGHLPRLGLNGVGGASALGVAACLDNGSPHVTYGAMARQPLKIPNRFLIFQNLHFHGFWLQHWSRTASPGEKQSLYHRLSELLALGRLHTPVEQIFSLAEIHRALEADASPTRHGKILLRLS